MKRESRTVDQSHQGDSQPQRQLPLVDLLVDTRAELLELAVSSGLQVLTTMLEEDRTAICGPRYEHQRSPSTRPQRRGVRQSSSHRPGRRTSLATARGRPRGIGRSRWWRRSAGAAGRRRQGTIVRAGWRMRSSDTNPSSEMAFAPGTQPGRGVR